MYTHPPEAPVSKQLLFIPGPVTVAEPVLAAMGKPMVDHRGPEYKALQASVASKLKPVFGTTSDVLLLGSSGTGGLEAAVTNMFGPGEKILACPIGVFGERLLSIAKTWGIDVEVLPTEYGYGVDPVALKARLDAEYALPVEFEVSEFQLARWISSDDRKKLEAFIAANGSGVADDVDGDPVFLARNEFYLGYTRERAEGIVFSSIKDVKKRG